MSRFDIVSLRFFCLCFFNFLFFSCWFLGCRFGRRCLSCSCLGSRSFSSGCFCSRRCLGCCWGLSCRGLFLFFSLIGLSFFSCRSSFIFLLFCLSSGSGRVRLNYIILFGLFSFAFLFLYFVIFILLTGRSCFRSSFRCGVRSSGRSVRGGRWLFTSAFLDLLIFLFRHDNLNFLVIFRLNCLLEAISRNLVFKPFGDLIDK